MPKIFLITTRSDEDMIEQLSSKLTWGDRDIYTSNLGSRKFLLNLLFKEYGEDMVVKAIRKLLFYYKIKVLNKISYDLDKARDIFYSIDTLVTDIRDTLSTNLNYTGERLNDILSKDWNLYNMDVCLCSDSLKTFLKTDWKKWCTSLDVSGDMMRDLLIDIYYINGEKPLDEGMKLIYGTYGIHDIIPLKNKQMVELSKENNEPMLIFPAHFSTKYHIKGKLDKTQIDKAMIFGSYTKLMEESMEAYYENNPQRYLQEVGDIFITKYFIDVREELRRIGAIYEFKSTDKLLVMYNFRLSETARNEGLVKYKFNNIQNVFDFIPDDSWVISYDDKRNHSMELDADPYNILMYFKNKIEKEL